MALSWEDFDTYRRAVTVLEAQELLRDMNVADYPKMKREDRKAMFKNVRAAAFPKGSKEGAPMSLEQIRATIGRAING